MRTLKDDAGRLTFNEGEMESIARNYFFSLFSFRGRADLTPILSRINPRIPDEVNKKHMVPYSTSEIVEVLREMGPTKLQGIMGFLPCFS